MPVSPDAIAALQACRGGAYVLAERDPVTAAKVLARAARRQTRGAKVSLIRALVVELAEGEPGFAAAVATEIAYLADTQ